MISFPFHGNGAGLATGAVVVMDTITITMMIVIVRLAA
jgi:hypothetical protein